ncbi:MAG: Ig-like domain-containing protein [Pirellulales bacterium]
MLSFGSALQLDGVDDHSATGVDPFWDTGFSGKAGILTASPATPDLLADSDTGVSSTDNLTNLDNSGPDKRLQFAIGNTIARATVTLYADGTAIGSAVAESTTTTVTTNGSLDLADGTHAITARQSLPGEEESTDSAALTTTIDTMMPFFVNPVRLGEHHTTGGAEDMAVSGTRAYVADGRAGLVIIDVTNPAAPVRLGEYDILGHAEGIAVSGTLAYVANTFLAGPNHPNNIAGLDIFDVSNPATPVRLGRYETIGQGHGVAVSGTLAYLAGAEAGLVIIDVSNPAAPRRAGGWNTGGSANGVAISGTRAYVADTISKGPDNNPERIAGLEIVDVSNPAAPVRLGRYETSGQGYDVAVSGTLAYVATYDAGLVIIDVTNPAAPVFFGSYDTSGYAFGVAVSETLAYVADYFLLRIIDVSNPAKPWQLGSYYTGGSANEVVVSGTLVYVLDDGLQIIDVSPSGSPSAPDLRGTSDTGISSTDNITADNTPTFTLSVPTGFYFRVYRDGVQISGDYRTGVSYTTAVQADGTCDYSISVVDAAGNVSPQSPPLAVTIDTAAPAVIASAINGGAAQRSAITSLVIRFGEDVSASLGAGDLKLVNSVSGAAVDLSGVVPGYDAATHTAMWNLADVALEDSYYTATLTAAGIGDTAGNLLAGGNYAFEFFRLLGDTDGNASVDIFDVAKLQVNYGQTSGMMPADGDFDGNGTVDVLDVALLQVQYGRMLEPPAPVPAAAPSADAVDQAAPEPLLSTMPSAADDLAEAIAMARVSRPTSDTPLPTRPATNGDSLPQVGQQHRRAWRNATRASAVPSRPLSVNRGGERAAWESAVDLVLEGGSLRKRTYGLISWRPGKKAVRAGCGPGSSRCRIRCAQHYDRRATARLRTPVGRQPPPHKSIWCAQITPRNLGKGIKSRPRRPVASWRPGSALFDGSKGIL